MEEKKIVKKKIIKINLKKINNLMEYSDGEINDFSYDLAIQYDKRNYCQYYFSLLKTKHDFLYTFFYNNDHNSKIIKIDLFFIGFTMNYTVNALFFDDDTMHNIYENKGSFDILSELPKIIYSSLISMIIDYPLKYFALPNDDIIEFKRDKEKDNIKKSRLNLIKKLRIKFIIYIILSYIFLILYWYYISMFGAIYKNTQIHLLSDTLLSFGLSLISPFIIYLAPGIFRIPALSAPNKNRKCLYKFSKILQIF